MEARKHESTEARKYMHPTTLNHAEQRVWKAPQAGAPDVCLDAGAAQRLNWIKLAMRSRSSKNALPKRMSGCEPVPGECVGKFRHDERFEDEPEAHAFDASNFALSH